MNYNEWNKQFAKPAFGNPKGSKSRKVFKGFTGGPIDLANPSPSAFNLQDIARGLSRQPRYCGQTGPLYTVAQHSLLVWALAKEGAYSPEQQLLALLHDAPEAYMSDLVSPIKREVGTAYVEVELRLLGAICKRFGIQAYKKMPKWLKDLDDKALIIERRGYIEASSGLSAVVVKNKFIDIAKHLLEEIERNAIKTHKHPKRRGIN